MLVNRGNRVSYFEEFSQFSLGKCNLCNINGNKRNYGEGGGAMGNRFGRNQQFVFHVTFYDSCNKKI